MPATLAHRTGNDPVAVVVAGPAFIEVAAAESTEALAAGMKEDGRLITMAQARIVVRQAEFNRRQAYADDGATSLESWTAQSLLRKHHHGVVHRKGWSMTGNPNQELTIENPSGRVTVSRP